MCSRVRALLGACGVAVALTLGGAIGPGGMAALAAGPPPPPAPPPPPSSGCATISGYWVCNAQDPAHQVVDYPGTNSPGSPGSTPGPASCVGYYYSQSTTLIGVGAHYVTGNPNSPNNGALMWALGPPRGQSVFGSDGHVMVGTINLGAVSLADYLVVADYYQGVRYIPAVKAVKATPASAGPPPVAAVAAKPAVPAKCVNTGGAQFKGLSASPVCPQAGATLCGAPATNTQQVKDMYNYIVSTYLRGKLAGGQVTTVPAADAMVGLPTNVSLQGANLPVSETFSDSQVSTNTWKGRALVLTLNVSLSLSEVVYNWGDGIITKDYGLGATGTAGMNSSVQHTYYVVAFRGEHPTPYLVINAKDQIPVTAYGVEQLTATLSWIYPWGSVGSESLAPMTMFVPAVGAGVSSILPAPPSQATLQAHAAWIRVLQEEGIPFCPSPTNCS